MPLFTTRVGEVPQNARMPAVTAPLRTTVHPRLPVDVRLSLGSLRRGAGDPSMRSDTSGVTRAVRTPAGPGTVHLAPRPGGEVTVTAWGAGAEWLVATAPDLLGQRDAAQGWAPVSPLLRELTRRHPGLRTPRSGLVLDALVPSVLEQKVTGFEARRAWRDLLRRHGEVAPGPAGEEGMRVMPSPAALAGLPSWEWHQLGVDQKRWLVIRECARVAGRLEEVVAMELPAAHARLRVIRGVGPWTAAEVAQRALGDSDAVSVGDFHLPALVGHALSGQRTDDEGMLALLEPYRPHRYRAVRLIELSGLAAPRRGPRMAPRDFRRI